MNNKSILIKSINISKQKGVVKTPEKEVIIDESGIIGDAHNGNWHRQISLLDETSFNKQSKILGKSLENGSFAENITTIGLDYNSINILDTLSNDNITLQITQLGKECHGKGCAIYRKSGSCVMPIEGIFANVLKGGVLNINDKLNYHPKVIRVLVIKCEINSNNIQSCSEEKLKIFSKELEKYFSINKIAFEIHHVTVTDNKEDINCVTNNASQSFDIILGINCVNYRKELIDLFQKDNSDANTLKINNRLQSVSDIGYFDRFSIEAIGKSILLTFECSNTTNEFNFKKAFDCLLPALYEANGIKQE